MKILAVFIALLCAGCSASHRWTKLDIARQTVLLAELEIDRRQTVNAHKDRWVRVNPDGSETIYGRYGEVGTFGILPLHPSHGDINRYLAAYAAVHTGVAAALPSRWTKNDPWWLPSPRALWQTIAIYDEALMIRMNYDLNIRP
jgi:hypothetical protein